MNNHIALKASNRSQPASNIIAVASGKGGVGKTWFSITLAHALAQQGEKTLLFDGDLGLANVDVQLGLMPDLDLGQVITGQVTLEQSIAAFTAGGFDVISGRSGSGALALSQTPALRKLKNEVTTLSQKYSAVILDLGAGVDGMVRSLIPETGTTLIVTNDEPTSITDAYAFIKIMLSHQSKTDMRIVVNAAMGKKDGHRTFNTLSKACETFLGYSPRLAGTIRRDLNIRDAIRHQAPMLSRFPVSMASQDVETIAMNLLKQR